MNEVLIVHTAETTEWADYLQIMLSQRFPAESITLFLVDEDSVHESDWTTYSSSKCIILVVSMLLLDIQSKPEVFDSFRSLLRPPQTVVAFLCGILEDDVSLDDFPDWESWRKLNTDDEPSLYLSTVLESIADGEKCVDQANTDQDHEAQDSQMEALGGPENTEASPASEETETPRTDERSAVSPTDQLPALSQTVSPGGWCHAVLPNRILCGTQVDVYVIMRDTLDRQANINIEFTSGESEAKWVSGTLVNEYTIQARCPDMPVGEVNLNFYNNQSVVGSISVTYYTAMEEINNYLKSEADPLQFMCQAFAITSNFSESLDTLLTDSLKKKMPPGGLQVFGINQLEINDTFANQHNVELPTLLHFSAKYGLKKLTTVLLQCPGAFQAYSVPNENGEYPNTLAERSGFTDLRRFMDNYVETADMVKSSEESMEQPTSEQIYEDMITASKDLFLKFSLPKDIYESMEKLDPDFKEDLYEDIDSTLMESQDPDEAILRKFLQVKPDRRVVPEEGNLTDDYPDKDGRVEGEDNPEELKDDEDPYNRCFPEQIYDTVDEQLSCIPEILNRPPAPVPRPSSVPTPAENQTYISRVFVAKNSVSDPVRPLARTQGQSFKDGAGPEGVPRPQSTYDPYGGMKTPGQRQLIALQERVKMGSLNVEEAVQEFKAWHLDQEGRAQSLRFQQENLQKLRDSITRRQKERGRDRRETDLEITAPLQRNLRWGTQMNLECSVYEPTLHNVNRPPPVSRSPQRGTWQTDSTSSTSSGESNRLSTFNSVSYSSGVDGEVEEIQESPAPPRPPRNIEVSPDPPPPRIPPRLPERLPESMLHERYISSPVRVRTQHPPHRPIPPPPVPRRAR